MNGNTSYDWRRDMLESYALAIKELRRKAVVSGRAAPVSDEERQWLEQKS